jgi:hypothetical protein
MEAKVRGVPPEDLRPDRPRVSALRVASEFEHTFGRNALDEFLRATLDDANLLPGELHRVLLSLPWSDIFTTNYDRLLERASSAVVDRKYDLVLGAGDIPGTLKPRIVKLHGSFSSHRPFIITEEDYRTYPQKFAPFVNMVQQSIMENAFCLLGFSGDDPNFVAWIGWVRDNLGTATPPIYLVGVMDLSEWQRDVLARRGVTPVDIGPLFPKTEWPERSSRHRGALLWFLRSLQNGVPADPNDWPSELGPTTRNTSPGALPASIPPDITRRAPTRAALLAETTPEQFELLRTEWEADRRRYPGWLTCPPENRKRLWRDTEYVLGGGLQTLVKMPPTQSLLLLYELTWRLSRLEAPAYDPIPTLISDVLGRVNPFPALLELDGALTPRHSDGTASWDRLGECWREVAEFALIWARRDGDASAFEKYSGWLGSVAQTSPHLPAFLSWQRCLRFLNEFGFSALEAELERWIPTPHLPVWEVRRGALLAELGDMREAQATLSRALEEIRSRLGTAVDDRELLSQEGWAMAILRAVSMQLNVEPVDHRTYTRRWARLERYGASPWDDVESFRELLRNFPEKRASLEIRKEFDPGAYTTTSRFGSGDPNLSAFQALGVLERSGAPLRAGTDNTFGGLAQLAAMQVVEWSPEWALSAIVRSDSVDKAEGALSRPRIMALDSAEAARVIGHALDGLEGALPRLEGDRGSRDRPTLARRFVDNLSELLSRLTLRMSAGERARALRLACDGLASTRVRQEWALWKPLGHLLNRTLEVMQDDELASVLPTVLGLPIPGERGFESLGSRVQAWPEPFEGLRVRRGLSIGGCARIHELIEHVRGGDHVLRTRAATRLSWLDEGGLLASLREGFGQALWAVTDPTSRLPASTPFLKSAFLTLPAPPGVDPTSLVRAHALSVPFPPMSEAIALPNGVRARSVGFPNRAREHFRELTGMSSVLHGEVPNRIVWTPQEAQGLLDQAHAWWNSEANHYRKVKAPRMVALGSAEQVVSSFVEMVGLAVAPYLDPSATPDALRLFDALEGDGVPTLAARAVLQGRNAAAPVLVDRIRAALALDGASDGSVVEDALQAVAVSLVGNHGRTAPGELLDDVLVRILSGRHQANHLALRVATAIVRRRPGVVGATQRKLLEAVLLVLLSDTSPDSGDDNDVRPGLVPEERPEFRRLAAELAGTLFAAEKKEGVSPSVALTRWEGIGDSDPLPEVRSAWRAAVGK